MSVRLERKPVECPSMIQSHNSWRACTFGTCCTGSATLGAQRVCECKQVEQGGGCKCQSVWTQQGHNVQTQTHRHKMQSNSHLRVNSSTSQSLTSLRDIKYNRRALYWPSVEDRRWKRKLMTNLQKSGKAACAASLLQEQEWFKTNTITSNGRFESYLRFRLRRKVYQRDLRTNPCAYLPLSALDRWAD